MIHIVPKTYTDHHRLDTYLTLILEFQYYINSRSAAYKLIKKNKILINDKTGQTSQFIKIGMKIVNF